MEPSLIRLSLPRQRGCRAATAEIAAIKTQHGLGFSSICGREPRATAVLGLYLSRPRVCLCLGGSGGSVGCITTGEHVERERTAFLGISKLVILVAGPPSPPKGPRGPKGRCLALVTSTSSRGRECVERAFVATMASSKGEGGPQIFMDIRIGDRNGEWFTFFALRRDRCLRCCVWQGKDRTCYSCTAVYHIIRYDGSVCCCTAVAPSMPHPHLLVFSTDRPLLKVESCFGRQLARSEREVYHYITCPGHFTAVAVVRWCC